MSDAHGNPEGVERCLSVLRSAGAEKIYFLGDAVGYLSGWEEVLHLLNNNGVQCLKGNHDQRVIEMGTVSEDTSAYQLLPEYREKIRAFLPWMESWPEVIELRLSERNVLFVHGSPLSPLSGYFYPWSDFSPIAHIKADVVVMGHTHRPFVLDYNGKILINAGSCGLPRDIGNLASCAVLDTESGKCEIYRTPFDVNRLLARVARPHPDVLCCLERRTDQYVGTLVTEELYGYCEKK